MPSPTPQRGELWWFDPDPVRGRELGHKVRPGLIVSSDIVNAGPSGKVIVVPGTTQDHQIASHVRFDYAWQGRPVTTFFCCEDVRSISVERLGNRMAPKPVPARIMTQVVDWLKRLMDLP
jgi:mRNA interferase MazF